MPKPPLTESAPAASTAARTEAAQSEADVPPKPELVHVRAMQELLDWLCRNRKRLVIIYLSLMAAWMSLILFDPFSMLAPNLFAYPGLSWKKGPVNPIPMFVVLALFLALHAAFLFGGGRIRIRPGPTKWYRMVVSIVIFSGLMAILGLAFVWTYFQLTGRMPTGNRPAAGMEQFDLWSFLHDLGSPEPDSNLLSRTIVRILGGLWLFWFVIGFIAMRTTDQAGGIGRLVAVLLAGSWIEFAVALPVDLVTRQRDKECPCVSGSWFALVFCFPILIWSIGPALYLLFLREKVYCRRDARHSRRVLLRKSVRDPQPDMLS